MKNFIKELKNTIEGDVLFDSASCAAYSVDASIYEVHPIAIASPKTQHDLKTIVKIAQKYHIPITPRGAATGTCGSCLGKGLIIDTAKYLTRIHHIDTKKMTATCDPGVVLDDLNQELLKTGHIFGADTSTSNRATIGGMIANNAAGSLSIRYGMTYDHIEALECILQDGTLITFSPLNEKKFLEKCNLSTKEGSIYRKIHRIIYTYKEAILKMFPKIERRVSGYNLNTLLENPINLSRLISGSEGTLCVISKVKLKIIKRPKDIHTHLFYFDSLEKAFEKVCPLLEKNPLSIELIDDKIIQLGKNAPLLKGKLNWLDTNSKAILIVETDSQSKPLSEGVILKDKEKVKQIWNLRKAGLGLLMSKRSFQRALAFIEDMTVAPDQLSPFISEILSLLRSHEKDVGIYGHVGAGCIHIRPFLNLSRQEDLTLMKQLLEKASDIVKKYKGAMSGEHGDGLIRSFLNKKMFGSTLYQAFLEVKKAFDPSNLMNPGKVISSSDFIEQDLRLSPKTQFNDIPTFLDFSKEGGIVLSADLCNGNGQCRKKTQVMCPSFQATNDERDTTRARAQALRDIFTNRITPSNFSNKEVYRILDLCLQCKGCKKECPSNVDMAKMKSEYLFHYYANRWNLRNKMIANIGTIQNTFSSFPRLYNFFINSFIGKLGRSFLGITPYRDLPLLAEKRFSSLVKEKSFYNFNRQVVFFNDTYNEFNHPEIGLAALHVLNKIGFKPIIPKWQCCGRPYLTKGLLFQAKQKASHLIDTLYPYAKEGIYIIGLEPSCLLSIVDDYPSLLGYHNQKASLVSKFCLTFDQFLFKLYKEKSLYLPKLKKTQILVHGHCHQKATVGTEDMLNFLNAIDGVSAKEANAGCCGVAGSFGYEKEHYNLSMKIGNDRLLPAVKQADQKTIIIANGVSCRNQITHGTGKKAIHFAQFLAKIL